MNYYKSINHPFNKGINFVLLTVNGDFFYYGTEEITNDVPITEEEYNLEVAKEEHVSFVSDDTELQISDEEIQAELLINQMEILENQDIMNAVLSELYLNTME